MVMRFSNNNNHSDNLNVPEDQQIMISRLKELGIINRERCLSDTPTPQSHVLTTNVVTTASPTSLDRGSSTIAVENKTSSPILSQDLSNIINNEEIDVHLPISSSPKMKGRSSSGIVNKLRQNLGSRKKSDAGQ